MHPREYSQDMEAKSVADTFCMCSCCGVWLRGSRDVQFDDSEGLSEVMYMEQAFRKIYGEGLDNESQLAHIVHKTNHLATLELMCDGELDGKEAGDEVKYDFLVSGKTRRVYIFEPNAMPVLDVGRIYEAIVYPDAFELGERMIMCKRCNIQSTNAVEFAHILYRAPRPLIVKGAVSCEEGESKQPVIAPYLAFFLQYCWVPGWDPVHRKSHLALCWLALQVCACMRDISNDSEKDRRGQHTKFANLEYYTGVFCYRMLQSQKENVFVTLEHFLLMYFYELHRCPANAERLTVKDMLLSRSIKSLVSGNQRALFERTVGALMDFHKKWVEDYIFLALAEAPTADPFFPLSKEVIFFDNCSSTILGKDVARYVQALGTNFMLSRFGKVAEWTAIEFLEVVDNMYDFFADREIGSICKHSYDRRNRVFRGSLRFVDAEYYWRKARAMGALSDKQQRSAVGALGEYYKIEALGRFAVWNRRDKRQGRD